MAEQIKKKKKSGRNKKKGLPPGSLVFVGDQKTEKATLDLFFYNEEKVEQKQDLPLSQIIEELKNITTTCWLNVNGLHDTNILKEIGTAFDINKLALEDILNTEQRPKLDAYDNFVVSIVKMFHFDTITKSVRMEQVSVIFTKNFVITFQEKPGDVFDDLRDRIINKKGVIRSKGADYLFYALLDTLTDHYFFTLEQIGESLESIEDIILTSPSQNTLNQLHFFKKEITQIRRAIYPLREVVSKIERNDNNFIAESNIWYYRDLHDHTIQIIETIETYRDSASGLVDLYMSSVGNRMNNIMKVLTIISTIFIPLTFIAGIYGMNFSHMPELQWHYGYYAVWGIMLLTTIIMIIFFRKKNWF